MTTDNKTLADVQPGGRVRLGDQDEKPPQELPELIVTRGDGIPLPDQAAGIEEFKRQCLRRIETEYPHLSAQPSQPSSLDLEAMLATCVPGGSIVDPQVIADNIRHWFSAHPSPGGQGDAVVRAINSKDLYQVLMDVQNGIDSPALAGMANGAIRLIDKARAELAARQPVGSEYIVSGTMEDAEAASDGMLPAALVPVADEWYRLCERRFAVDRIRISGQLAEAIVEAVCAAPAQAVDLGQLIPRPKAVPDEFAEDDSDAQYNSGWNDCRDAVLALIDSDAKAQAVDLADFKALYRAYVRLLESGRDRIIGLGGTCDPVDVMEANDVDLQAARRVIGSQAVGK